MRDGEAGEGESMLMSRSTSASSLEEGSASPSRGMRSVGGYVPVRTVEEDVVGRRADEKV